ncbi:chromate transporter [Oscillibacter sp. 1-3]|uniref:chromate transporter n=1 Tax=Oscillibacter sp. 1-3 TaxID=1235797 RepID=UPI00033F22BC|nr:chromate transporter [Oscillibacter sp. 1-3]EOS64821.1 hypothetical protein C816_02546 [Oscillibacter sp. 1-3]MCI9511325.1 chromate transporter [Oscillibacter sp.]
MGKICWKLFTSMLALSGLTFGGGFVIIPLMQRRFADELGWLTQEEILDMTAFARASPGAVTVNVAVQVGARMAGAAGALCGVLGTILPPLAILSALSLCYEAFSASPVIAALLYGLRLAVAVVVADASAAMAMEILRGGDRLRRAVMGAVLLLSLTTGIGTIWLLAGGALLGWLLAGRNAS